MKKIPVELSEKEFVCNKCGATASSAQACPRDGSQMISYDDWIARRNAGAQSVGQILVRLLLIVGAVYFGWYLYETFVLQIGSPPPQPILIR